MATRALKISGNKGVDAALETIQKLCHQEGRNGFARAATTGQVIYITTLINTAYGNFMRFDFYYGSLFISGLQVYASKVTRKPSFEEKYGKSSPVHSENSSIRSESPNMGRTQHCGLGGDSMRQAGQHQTNLAVPGYQSQMLPPERQPSPPPLPPRASHGGPAPPPVPPQTYKSHSNGSQQVPLPPLSRRMSPVPRDSSYRCTPGPAPPGHPQIQASPASSVHSGAMTPQRGTSPSSAHQPVIKQQNVYQPSSFTTIGLKG